MGFKSVRCHQIPVSVSQMRIAYLIINHNKREGTSKAIAEVAERLAARHEVHVFSRTATGVDLRRLRLHRIPGPRYPHVAEFLGYALPCHFMLRTGQFDIVHAAGAVSNRAHIYTIQNIQPAKAQVLRTLESDERVGLARRWSRRAYLYTTSAAEQRAYRWRSSPQPWFLPVSSGVRKELKDFHGIHDERCRIIPNAADTDRFRPVPQDRKNAIRASFNLGPNDTVCAFSGGEWRRKGLDLAIRALAAIRRKEVKLLVLGHDGALGEFEGLAEECDVRPQVRFAGFREAVEEGLACADLFLFPSRYEAFSLATLEAAACGLPIVAPRINGIEDFIEPGVNGDFIEHDPVQIATALRPLISDLSICRRMGIAARETVKAKYTWERVAAMTEEVYLDYLKATRTHGTALKAALM